ncbi:MAG: ABC transporter permease [Alphaproteobacteria bacterium]|nr:MAG: ABC transporter permease [Alphaproteobacteria bacterium]
MAAMLQRRLLESALSLAFLLVAVFILARLTGDPSALYLPETATDEMRAEFARQKGFDQPIWQQFFTYLGELVRFEFGDSLRQQRPALNAVLEAYPATLQLVLWTILAAVATGVLVGCLASLRPGSPLDRTLVGITVTGASIPDFWLALMGILVFAIWLGWLPTSGMATPVHWVLPVTVLMLRPAGSIAQVVRGSMISTLASPYVKAARGRGLPLVRIVFFHALRNAAIPVITLVGVQTASILNGAVIVETIFAFPGIGRLMINSILDRDFAVVQASVVLIAVAIFTLNILIDLLYGWVDPRVRTH